MYKMVIFGLENIFELFKKTHCSHKRDSQLKKKKKKKKKVKTKQMNVILMNMLIANW